MSAAVAEKVISGSAHIAKTLLFIAAGPICGKRASSGRPEVVEKLYRSDSAGVE